MGRRQLCSSRRTAPRNSPARAGINAPLLFVALHFLLARALASTATASGRQNAAAPPAPSPYPFPDLSKAGKLVQDAAEHLSSLSTEAPIAAYLREHKIASKTFPQIQRLITGVDKVVSDHVAETHNETRKMKNTPVFYNPKVIKSCHRAKDEWFNDVDVYNLARGLAMLDMPCISVANACAVAPCGNNTGQDAFNAIRNHAHGLNKAAPAMIQSMRESDPVMAARLANWTTRGGTTTYATRPTSFTFSEPDQECTYDHVGFVRQTGAWFAVVSLTNAPPAVVEPRFTREYVHEFVNLVYPGPDGEPTGPAWEVMARESAAETAPGANRTWVRGTTTLLQTDFGAASTGTFARVPPRDNIAVQGALKLGAHNVQQGSDATTASNIAILAFPLVLSAVPVALLASVNPAGLLAYTLLTDVLTAVPLAIKGVELLVIGQQSYRAVLVRISGGDLPGPDIEKDEKGNYIYKAAEAWAAECRPTASLRSTGIILVAVAVVCMVMGVVAEVWARDYVRRRKKKAEASGIVEDKPNEAPMGWLVVSGVKHRSISGNGNSPPMSSSSSYPRGDV